MYDRRCRFYASYNILSSFFSPSLSVIAIAWSISKTSPCKALWEKAGSSQTLTCGKENIEHLKNPKTKQRKNQIFCVSVFHTHTHTYSISITAQTLISPRTKVNQCSLINDVKRHDKKRVIRLSECISLHTQTQTDTHTPNGWTSPDVASADSDLQPLLYAEWPLMVDLQLLEQAWAN